MASVLTKSFTVNLHEDLETVHRAARRVICTTDFLKAAKLSAGDVIAIAGGSDLTPEKVKHTYTSNTAPRLMCPSSP